MVLHIKLVEFIMRMKDLALAATYRASLVPSGGFSVSKCSFKGHPFIVLNGSSPVKYHMLLGDNNSRAILDVDGKVL